MLRDVSVTSQNTGHTLRAWLFLDAVVVCFRRAMALNLAVTGPGKKTFGPHRVGIGGGGLRGLGRSFVGPVRYGKVDYFGPRTIVSDRWFIVSDLC